MGEEKARAKKQKESEEAQMRNRLIELIKDAEKAFPKDKPVLDIEEFVADHLLANGVIVPPCKVGDVVYCVGWRSKKVYPKNVEEILLREDEGYIYCACSYMSFEQFGKTVFLTREEAEKALERSGE